MKTLKIKSSYTFNTLYSITIFSLAGLPPFLTFFTKINILLSLFRENYIITIFVVVIFNILNTIYYINLLRDASFTNVKTKNQKSYNFLQFIPFNLNIIFLILMLHCGLFFTYNY